MAAPARIKTDKRYDALKAIQEKAKGLEAQIDGIIADLSKPHVDDKQVAKRLLGNAKKISKSLAGVGLVAVTP